MQGMAEPIPAARAEQTEPKYYEEEYSCCDGRLYNVYACSESGLKRKGPSSLLFSSKP